MKSLLFILLLAPAIGFAQIEAGVAAGMIPWRPDFHDHPDQHFDIHGMGAVNVAYNFDFIKAGVSYTRATLASTGTYGTLNDHLMFQGDPFNEIDIFAAYFSHYNRTDNYVGATVGRIFYESHFQGTPPIVGSGTSGSGWGYGIFVGSTYRIFAGFCINVQLGANRANLADDNLKAGTFGKYWYFPLSAGIHYKFGIHPRCKVKEKM